MKKTLLFLSCIFSLLSFSGCSKDDATLAGENNTKSTKIKWYGVNIPKEISTRGVSDEGNLWNQRVGIYIKFLNAPKDETQLEQIKQIATEWERYAGIKFHFVDRDAKASVRIAFDWQGNDWLTWSYTGTDAKNVSNQNEPTAVFGGLQYQNTKEFRGDVLRVFGQILGLEYEQRHQDWTFWKSETQLQRYWENMFYGMNMDWDEIREYVFTPLTGDNAISPTQTPQIDELSIMAWPYYTRAQTTNMIANTDLSKGDKEFIATLYPKDKEALPTIQEAWVDPGYFEWSSDNKVALTMTDLGRQQEYLPDVSDGEQLKYVDGIFSQLGDNGMYKTVKLKKAPFFNTSNITDMTNMFHGCKSLTEVPQYNTSKVESFFSMFQDCTSLTSIPLFDTANGIDFSQMFMSSGIKTIPLLDTSKGISFYMMFAYCPSLTTIPQINTSEGTIFGFMFQDCTSLTSIANIDTSNGTVFTWMFKNCKSLKTISQLDMSKNGEGGMLTLNFQSVFYGCTSLTTVSKLDIPNNGDFGSMFENCTSLETVEILHKPTKGNFGYMFAYCNSLKEMPITFPNLSPEEQIRWYNSIYRGTRFEKYD